MSSATAANLDRRPVGRGGAVGQDRTITVEDVDKFYGHSPALQGVSFRLCDGEFLTLLGPSGSGKTTMLGVIAGFVDPSHGNVLIGTTAITHLPARRRNLGIVFQNYALFPHLTVAANVEFGLRMRRVRRVVRRHHAEEMLNRVGLEGFGDRKPAQLSGGQQQRVALARALIIDPAALLLDEPLGALDRRLRQQVQMELKGIQRNTGVSVLYVTHDQEEAMVMSDRVAVMRDGAIQQIDTPMNVYKYPKTRFVAEFLGEANLFEVTVQEVRGSRAMVSYADGSRGLVHISGGAPPSSGRPGTVCVRPERVRLDGNAAQNTVSGVVTGSTYLGSSVRCSIQALGREIIATWPDLGSRALPQPGTHVFLSWGAEDGQLIGEEDHGVAEKLSIEEAMGGAPRQKGDAVPRLDPE